MRAAALCAAHSRTTRQVFDARKDQAGNCVYCSKKERSDELIPTKLYDIFFRPALRSAACRMHLPTTLTANLTGAARRLRARASNTHTPVSLPRTPAWLCSELSCVRPALSCSQLP